MDGDMRVEILGDGYDIPDGIRADDDDDGDEDDEASCCNHHS